ncbi:Hypothetical Protein FCC1311_053112 [Hondaea fermentalgiana]|uniref:Uncharacterized protein n=1 Tax=Hondaea fermentalgiana TaxID=2315210 RepID=A0A2R5GH71_9STRA|nr:Hypothetical Protein FCC1311_053112 [Hondaea fermentalgiana]|eukprot:GBG29088.1 Hypothetical Protein FCC1311_053112 [Hondaea fermentalgiana]
MLAFGFVVGIITFAVPVAGFQGVLGVSILVACILYLNHRFPGLVGNFGSSTKYFLFGVTIGVDLIPLYQLITYLVKGIEGGLLARSDDGADLEASAACAQRYQFSIQARCYEEGRVFPGAQFPRYRFIFWMHVVGASLALFLGIFLFYTPFRRSYRAAHRAIGRVYAVSVLASATGSFWLGLTSEGGLAVNATFVVVSVFWFVSIIVAVYFAVRRNIVRHKAWMVRNYWGVTWGSTSLRWQLEFFYKGLEIPFQVAYSFAVVTSLLPVIVLVEFYIHKYHYPAYEEATDDVADLDDFDFQCAKQDTDSEQNEQLPTEASHDGGAAPTSTSSVLVRA